VLHSSNNNKRIDRHVKPSDGNQTGDFISVDDVVNVILFAAEAEIFLLRCVGTEIGTKVGYLAQMMIGIFNLNFEPILAQPRHADILHSVADTNRLGC